jgi:hypothetical protein
LVVAASMKMKLLQASRRRNGAVETHGVRLGVRLGDEMALMRKAQ